MNGSTDDLTIRKVPGGPVASDQPDRLAEAFAVLAEHRDRIVPVVGAGLAISAGAPSAPALAGHLREAGGLEEASGVDLFEVADTLETTRGANWVKAEAARLVADAEIAPTAVLRNLARLPSGIIATTNYDDAITVAAEAAGREPRLFWGPTLNQGLQPPAPGVVHVLHLHGHHSDPNSLILSEASYNAAITDPAVEHAVRALASQFVLILLGQRLAEREEHVHQNLMWSAGAFLNTGPHRIFLAVDELEREDLAALVADSALTIAPFRNPGHAFDVVRVVAQHIGLGLPQDRPTLPDRLRALKTDVFVPIPIYPAAELAGSSQRQVLEMAGTALNRHIDLPQLLGNPRAMLFGDPGTGKTQTLLEAGRLANRQHVVYVPLSSATELPPATPPIDEFVSWMAHASTFAPGSETPNRRRLLDTVYLFLLDGLDEVPRHRRQHVLQVIDQVASDHPYQLFLIASRPFAGAAESVPAGFTSFHLIPDRAWFARYLDQVDVSDVDLHRTVPPDHPLHALVHLPIFAVAVADAARDDRALPTSPAAAICEVARKGLDRTRHLGQDPDAIDRWLDVLAVVAEATGTNGLATQTAVDPTLASPAGVTPDDELLEHCVERALVVIDGDTVRFPANIIQEARAARALTSLPGGLDLLRSHALLTLPDGTAGVHPSWRHVVELACYDAGPEFRRDVTGYDPRLAARGTPQGADAAERDAAVRTLLDWYDNRRVWWTHGSDEAQLRTDLDAVAALATDPTIHAWAVHWAMQRLDAGDRTRRGNAIQLLSHLGERDRVVDALPSLLRDADSVVRRNAVHAHAEQQLTGFEDDLRAALDAGPDELEQRSLLAEYIRTGPADGIVDLLHGRWPAGMDSYEATRALDLRFTRHEQLQMLVDLDRYAEGWFDHLLSRKDDRWTPGEVELLATYTGRQPRSRAHLHHIRPILHQHLEVALPALWEPDRCTADYLLIDSSSATLRDLADFGLPDQIAAEIEQVLDSRSAPSTASAPPARVAPRAARAVQVEAVRGAGPDALLEVPVDQLERLFAEHPDDADLRATAGHAWSGAIEADRHPVHRIRMVDDHSWRPESPDDWTLLHIGARLHPPLGESDWLRLVELGIPGEEFAEWLRATMPDDPYALIEPRIATFASGAVRQATRVLLAAETPRDLAVALARRLVEAEDQHGIEQYLADLADTHRLDVLRDLDGTVDRLGLLPHLARAGDCNAEQQLLLDELGRDVAPRWRHAGDRHWLDQLTCPDSAELVTRRIVAAEAGGADPAYLAKLHQALQRTAGLDGLAAYDRLMAKSTYDGAPFLWFRRAELRDELLAASTSWTDEPPARAHLVGALMGPTTL